MGKPYKSEIQCLEETYNFASQIKIDEIKEFIVDTMDASLIAVGSGGSFSAAQMAVLLHQMGGALASSMTPLQLLSTDVTLARSNILLITAGGKNKDILSAFQHAVNAEPRNLLSLCARSASPIQQKSMEYFFPQYVGFDLPCGKDGFLATNSLIAFMTLLIRSYSECLNLNIRLPKVLNDICQLPSAQEINPLLEKDTWIVLYGKWGLPAAVDIESKFTEAALGHVQLADYRNFGHGRHHWLAKRGDTAGILLLVTKEEEDIAKRICSALPQAVPKAILSSSENGPAASLELLLKIFCIVGIVGEARGIDPGRPGVPAFGSRLYNMSIPAKKFDRLATFSKNNRYAAAISRKCNKRTHSQISIKDIELTKNSCEQYLKKLKSVCYGAIVFDYDGTLCDGNERFDGPSPEVIDELVKLLRANIMVGIATGRGRSVGDALRRAIPSELWTNVIIGYYNGSDIALLSDSTKPQKEGHLNSALEIVKKKMSSSIEFTKMVDYEVRPNQITIVPKSMVNRQDVKELLQVIVYSENSLGAKLLESSHSFDIVSPSTSKIAVINSCHIRLASSSPDLKVLCVGDRGEWPGNDFELLSTDYSISIDTVSDDLLSCWNYSPPGYRGVKATLYLLQNDVIISEDKGQFKLRLN